jgi:YggT family protein
VLTAAIFIRVLLSWFPIDPHNPLVTVLYEITEPILEPLRRVVPRLGMFDLTPMVAIILIQVIGNFAAGALR